LISAAPLRPSFFSLFQMSISPPNATGSRAEARLPAAQPKRLND
jgi:hypothetical protein